jgi:hypothetical protein
MGGENQGKINEILEGPARFNLERLRELTELGATRDEKYDYIDDRLERIGHGSSRVVFAIDEGMVVKFSMSEVGDKQNEVEVEVFTNPKTRPVIARVYDVADDYSWLIAERAEQVWSGRIRELMGMDFRTLERYLGGAAIMKYIYQLILSRTSGEQLPEYSSERLAHFLGEEFLSADMDKINEVFDNYSRSLKSFEQRHWGGEVPDEIRAIVLLNDYSDLALGDLMKHDSWGVTGEGRLVLFDYGATDQIIWEYY